MDYIQLSRRIVHQRETESVQRHKRVPKSVTFKTIAKLKGKLILLRKKEMTSYGHFLSPENVCLATGMETYLASSGLYPL